MSASIEGQRQDLLVRVRESASRFLASVEKKFEIKLDYTEASLYQADTLLSLFFKERRAFDLAVTLIGSYLGELLIGNLGGKWEPRDLSVVKIGRMKGIAYPFRQARKRLEKGLGEALTTWYARLKMDFCHSGELFWDGQVSKEFFTHLNAQGWDLRLLHRLLDDEEKPYVREEAAHLLGRLKSLRVSRALLDALESWHQAYYACIALQGIEEPRALPRLRQLCGNNAEMVVRIQAIQAVGQHRDAESVDALVEMLNEDDEIICHYASQALAKIGGERTVRLLIEIMANERPGSKLCTISALELLGDRACVPYLIESLFDRNEEIREAATRAFQYIPDERALGPLLFLLNDRSSRIRILAAYALAFIGDGRAVEPMRKLLKDPVKDVRDHAAYLLPLVEGGARPAGFCW